MSVSLTGNVYCLSKLLRPAWKHRFSRNHYRLVTTVNLERFTHAQMSDMHLVYVSVNGNGASPFQHCSEESFGSRIDGSAEVTLWPGHARHLTSRVWISFSGGHVKKLVYETVVETEDHLVARITVAAGTIADMPEILERTRQSMV